MTDPDLDALDALLQRPLLQPPPGFAQRVVQRLPRRVAPPSAWSRLRWLLVATGLAGGGVLGLSQIVGFVFGLWFTAAAL